MAMAASDEVVGLRQLRAVRDVEATMRISERAAGGVHIDHGHRSAPPYEIRLAS
jgi:hypothetical protein